jgi:TatD DNase family protein
VIDSHTHLDSCEPPNEELVAAAREAGLTRILTVGMDRDSCRSAIVAAETFAEVHVAIGRHPNTTAAVTDEDLEDVAQLARHPRCVAVGETGLDFYRDRAPRADQERAFRFQVDLARELRKPLIIHTRAADDATIATLDEHASGLEVVLHCFSMPGRLGDCAARGWWISFAGNVTYPAASDLAAAAAAAPAERLLVETDAPYLTPQVVRKQRNQPAYVSHTARFVAQQRGISYEELDALVTRNAATLFSW